MKILVIGSGGREHAICKALQTGTTPPTIFIAPGNPGTATCGTNIDIPVSSVHELVQFAKQNAIDLVIPGPELPLVLGLTDAMEQAGIACCGPTKIPAQLEASKRYTRELAHTVNAPSPKFVVVQTVHDLTEAINNWEGLPVIKADGLASGKGVFLPDTQQDCISIGKNLLEGQLGDAGKTIVLEERLEGIEVSLFYACNGTEALALPNARDHKRLLDDDQGPNTGGMGAISPNPTMTPEIEAQIMQETILPTLRELERQGTPFNGFLFAGLMLTSDGPKLLEYNVRLGDPETQAILPRIANGMFAQLCAKIATNQLAGYTLSFDSRASCAVVFSAQGYPSAPRKGDPITISSDLETRERWLIHAGTIQDGHTIKTNGGRVAAVVALSSTVSGARQSAYDGVKLVQFQGSHTRTDIGSPKLGETY